MVPCYHASRYSRGSYKLTKLRGIEGEPRTSPHDPPHLWPPVATPTGAGRVDRGTVGSAHPSKRGQSSHRNEAATDGAIVRRGVLQDPGRVAPSCQGVGVRTVRGGVTLPPRQLVMKESRPRPAQGGGEVENGVRCREPLVLVAPNAARFHIGGSDTMRHRSRRFSPTQSIRRHRSASTRGS